MSYLRTVITYNQPSEAEVDKAFLESHGMAVCLLNANTSRNEWGAPFYIQLQVSEDEYPRAVALLKAANPQRFGSAARVAEIEQSIVRGLTWFSIPTIGFGIIGFFLADAPSGYEMDMRMPTALSVGGLAGIIAVLVMKKMGKKSG